MRCYIHLTWYYFFLLIHLLFAQYLIIESVTAARMAAFAPTAEVVEATVALEHSMPFSNT